MGERMSDIAGMTSEQDPYTRAQELREGATPTDQEVIALTLHLGGHEFTPTFNRRVAAHLSRGQIRAILAR